MVNKDEYIFACVYKLGAYCSLPLLSLFEPPVAT